MVAIRGRSVNQVWLVSVCIKVHLEIGDFLCRERIGRRQGRFWKQVRGSEKEKNPTKIQDNKVTLFLLVKC